ncbi:platelet glycoprotein 4 [Arapaima gigas]
MACCSTRNGLIAGAVLGALVAVLGGILIPVGDSIITSTVTKEAAIENGTTAYDNWVSTGAFVYRQFWLFEVTNPAEVVNQGATPEVVEKGPYTYRTRYLPKENITVHSNNTIAFLLPAGAIFERWMSVGPEEDNVTVLNLAVAGAYSLMPETLHGLLNSMINKNKTSLFQTRSVKEILWGYTDPMLRKEVGVFVPYNGTYDGYYNVFTGKDDISKVATIDRWQGQRSVSAEFSSTVTLKGIKMYRYTLPPLLLAAPSVNPDNKCFCGNVHVTKNCTIGGVLDISSCRDKVPIYISLPHFLHGSEILRETVRGLSPSTEHHSTYLDVEPTTGFTMNFAKRLQINMMYGPSSRITILNKVKDYTIFPVLWLNETATLDDETADMFKAELTSRVQTLEAVQIALLVLGSVLCVACAIAACVVRSKREKGKAAA